MIIHNPVITGSLQVNGSSVSSIEQLDSVSGSVAALNNATSSYALKDSISGSFTSLSSSLSTRLTDDEGSISSLNAATSSYLQNTTDTLTGDLTVTGTLTAQDLHVQEVTSSIIYSSGSNVFGNQSTNTQELKGSTQIISNKGTELLEYNSFNVADDSDTTKGIRLAYDSGSDAGVIAASDLGTGWKDILINPIGGDVGIGTTNPTAKVSIKSSGASGIVLESDSSNSSNSGRIFFSNSSTGNAIMTESGILTFRTGATPRSTSGTKRLSVESSGIVTIGDGSNSGTLQFENDVKTRKVVLYQGADNDNQFYGFGVENSTLVYSVYTTDDDHVFFAGTSSTTRNELMRIGGDGKVGIGTSSPNSWSSLDINGHMSSRGNISLYTGQGIKFNQYYNSGTVTDKAISSGYVSDIIFNTSTGILSFRGGSSTYTAGDDTSMSFNLNINASGSVGIGTLSSDSPLHINSTSTPQLLIQNVDGGTNAERIGIELDSSDIFRIKSLNDNNTVRTDNIITGNILTGNVGIGIDTPGYKLDVQGDMLVTESTRLATSSDATVTIGNSRESQPASSDTKLILRGKNLESGGTYYGDYGQLLFDTTSNYTGSSRKWLITNGYVANRFAIIRGASGQATPTLGAGGGVNNGTVSFVISDDGKVGIGSAAPEEKLTVDGTTSGAYIRISNAGSGDISSGFMIYNGSNLDTQIYTNPTFGNTTFLSREALAIRAGGSQRMAIFSNGNTSIGRTVDNVGGAPGSTAGRLNLYTDDGSSVWAQQIRHDSTTGNGLFIRAGASSSYYTAYFAGYDEANVHFVVRGDGRVGIGTNSPDTYLHVEGDSIAVGSAYNFSINANNDGNWGFQVQRTDGVDDYNTRMKFYPANGSTRKLGFWNASASEWMGYFDGSTSSDNRFIINGGAVGIGTTNPKTRLQVNEGAIGMSNTTGLPLNARLVKTGSTSVLFTIKVGAVGAWRAGHAFLKVSGAQNGLQEHHSAWYHLKLVHYYLSGVTQSGTSNPALIKDSGGDTGSYTLSVTATNNADPQEITINISDNSASTNSMIADIDCSFVEGIHDLY